MSHDFLGIGWSFPISARAEAGSAAQLAAEMARYEESVRQSVWLILSTAPGERVMRPDFGCGIHDLVFALDNPSTKGLAEHEVEQALLFWEPRINVIKVTVGEDPRAELEPSNLAAAYRRFFELESRRCFQSLPYQTREDLRRRALTAGAVVGGPQGATLQPEDVDEQIIREIGKKELPEYDAWRRARKEQLSGPGLLITIDYLVKATNSRFNVVYPFYLERRPVDV